MIFVNHKLKATFINIQTDDFYIQDIFKKYYNFEHLDINNNYFDKDIIKDYFSFSFVRNPYDNIISRYLYLKEDKIKNQDYFIDFNTFITNCNNIGNLKQCEQLYDLNKQLRINFIGKMENIDDDIITIITILNINEIAHINDSYKKKNNCLNQINEESFNFINRYFKDDFDIFSYKKEALYINFINFYDIYNEYRNDCGYITKIYKNINVINNNNMIQTELYDNYNNIIKNLFDGIYQYDKKNRFIKELNNDIENTLKEYKKLFIENKSRFEHVNSLFRLNREKAINKQKCNKCNFISFNCFTFLAHDYNCNKITTFYPRNNIRDENNIENIVNNWNIIFFNNDNEKILFDYLQKYNPQDLVNTYLLDTNKTHFDIYEHFVYNTAIFHFNNLNIKFDNKKHFIEFWYYNELSNSNFHLDKNEKIVRKSNIDIPFLSCIAYLNDNIFEPTVITNVSREMYNSKNLKNIQLCFSFPKKMKQITFQGGKYYHGAHNICDNSPGKKDRKIIVINLWDKEPLGIEIYKSNEKEILYNNTSDIITLSRNYEINILFLNEQYDSIFFEKILYKEHFSELKKLPYDNVEKNDLYIYKCFTNENRINTTKDKFIQRFIINNFYNNELCDFFIEESEQYALNNGGWNTETHNNHSTTDLQIKNIDNIFPPFLKTYKTITEIIQKSYHIEDEFTYLIDDAFIVKYDEFSQDFLGIHKDGSDISVNILLNDANEFIGGGTYFEDGLTSFLNKGDMLIHRGITRHSGLRITSGKRYILIIFIRILKP